MSKRRAKLNALIHNVARRTLARDAWQTNSYLFPLEPWQWGLLQRWMRRCRFEFRTTDDDGAVRSFEYRFIGFRA
ncbi:MAG: hypothetical protein Q8R16_02585 [bacterium]|nr:hypothetical protein [bacterium]